ncbi:MAG: hypothetical protein MUF04_00950 [Akkermansiaceae bacterium]|jgi:uncharacterized repeat protein (TIGR03943 family)|nr:hypothetical protein [Akkermansiaceae bacterium]
MNPVFRRVMFALAVLVWSGVVLYFYGSGRIVAYLAPDFRPLALAGGLGLAVLGLFTLLTAPRAAWCGHGEPDAGGEAHDHEATDLHPVMAFLLMVTPVLCSAVWTKDRFSAAALTRKGLYDTPAEMGVSLLPKPPPLTPELLKQRHPKTPEGFHPFSLIELFFATGDRDMQAVLGGLPVETEGRIIEERAHNPQGTRKRLYRLFLTCCIADSRAIPIVLEYGGPPPAIADDEWVKVRGTVRFLEEQDSVQAVLFVQDTVPAEPPPEESFFRKDHR